MKNARAAALSAALAVALLAAWPGPSTGAEKPPLRGVFADNFTLLEEPAPAPQAELTGPDGAPLTLAAFEGRVVVLNFWATWCAPCIREMPSLDRLQTQLSAEGLSVVAVSEDRGGAKVVEPFLEKLGLANLEMYLDPKGEFAREFAVRGLPTTMLVDRRGRLIGGLEGPAEWDEEDAVALVRFYLDQDAPAEGEELLKTGG